MRTEFHRQLDLLSSDLGQMCELAGAAMRGGTQALLDVDLDSAERVISGLDGISALNHGVEQRIFALLALQAPVAGDLRAVVGSLQVAADADRMGGLAAHVARIARRRHPAPVLPDEVHGHFAEMGQVAVAMADAAREVLIGGDPVQAKRIRDDDAAMDALHQRLFALVLGPDWRHGVGTAVDIVLLGRFYERFADHAAEIGRRVVFVTTGTIEP
jgi:phosphate transport system protein